MLQTSWATIAGSLRTWLQSARWDTSGSGIPEPLSDGMVRNPPFGHYIPQPLGRIRPIQRNDWGAAGFTAYQAGIVPYNPIGAGVVVPYRVPTLSGPVAGVQNGTGIYWSSQMTNNGIQPGTLPLYSPADLNAIFGPLVAPAAVPGIGPPARFINQPAPPGRF